MAKLTSDDSRLIDIVRAAKTRDLLLFVGAGTSAAAGLPSWDGLIEKFLPILSAVKAEQQVLDEINNLRSRGQLIDALTAIEHVVGASEFCSVIERAVEDRDIPLPRVLEAIAKLAPHVRSVLTTNIDRLLERAFPNDWTPIARVIPDFMQRDRLIFKLHGTIVERDSWVFTRDQYDRAMYNSPTYRSTFEALLRSRTIIFLGFGMSDDDLDQVLGPIRALSGSQSPKHYAIVPTTFASPYRTRSLQQAGVSLISYDNLDGTHGELLTIVERIASVLDEPSSSVFETQKVEVSASRDLSPGANRILRERSFAWEIKFLNCLVQEEFGAAEDLRRDLELGITTGNVLKLSPKRLFGWTSSQFAGLQKLVSTIDRLVNKAIPEGMGPLGEPGDAAKLAHAARRLGWVYREAIEWSLKWRALSVDDECETLVELGQTSSLQIVEELHEWSQKMATAVGKLPDIADGQDHSMSFQLVLRSANADTLAAEISRLGAYYCSDEAFD